MCGLCIGWILFTFPLQNLIVDHMAIAACGHSSIHYVMYSTAKI
jgi:hypothetical protein